MTNMRDHWIAERTAAGLALQQVFKDKEGPDRQVFGSILDAALSYYIDYCDKKIKEHPL